MKFKKSYSLLIVMAIFLLISIGSVCAANDSDVQAVSDESDIVSIDDASDIVLEEDDDTANDGDDAQKLIDTTIEASGNTKIKDNESAEITIDIKDNESKSIENIGKENISVKENDKDVDFSFADSKIIITAGNLTTTGTHNLIITYLGNGIYNTSSTEYNLSVYTNKTLNFPQDTVSSDGNTVEIPIQYTDALENYTIEEDKLKLNLTYTDSEGKIVSKIVDASEITKTYIKFNLDGAGLPATVVVNYTDGKSFIKTIKIKTATQIVAENEVSFKENTSYTIPLTLTDVNGNVINVSGSNFTISGATGGNTTYNKTSHNLIITGLKKGIYNITIKYKGNDTYFESNKNIILNIRGETSIVTDKDSLNINSTKDGEIKINITNGVDQSEINKDNLTVNFSYIENGEIKNIAVEYDLENGIIKFNLGDIEFTKGNLTLTYNNTLKKVINVTRIFNTKIEAINTEAEYQSGNFTFRLIDVDTNKPLANKTVILTTSLSVSAGSGVTITNSKTVSGTTDENGIAVIKNSEIYFQDSYFTGQIMTINVGKHSVDITSNDTTATKLTTNVTIKKADLNINIENFNEYYGTDKKVTISVTNKNTNDPMKFFIVKLQIPGTSSEYYYVQTNASGIAQIAVSGLYPNDYAFTASPNSTDNVNNTTAKKTVTIKKIPAKIDITSSLTINYNTGATVTFKVTNSLTGKAQSGMYVLVKLYTTATKYDQYLFQTNDKGTVSFSASLAVGKHKIEISSADTRYDATTLSKTITVKKSNGKFTAPKVTAYYKQDKYFTIKLTNTKNKKAIYNAKVNIKVYVSKNKYYNYNGYTGADGKLKLKIDLKPGTYKVVVSGADSKNYAAKKLTSKITVKKAPAKAIIQKSAKKSAKSFKVTVKNKKTKKVISGVKVKVKVYTGKKAKTFTVKTNSKGIAQVSTKSIKVGSHKVVVTSANKYVTLKQTKGTVKIKK